MFNFFNSKPDPRLIDLYNTSINQLEVFQNIKFLNSSGKYEFLIFCAFTLLSKNNIPNELKPKYIRYLIDQRKDYNINLNSIETINLINGRMRFHQEEFRKSFSINGYFFSKTYHIFYEKPLNPLPEPSLNLPEIVKFSAALIEAIQNLTK